MATTYKVLGQSYPTAATNTSLYTVPAASSAVVSTITVCNQSQTTGDTINIAVRPAGASIATQHYLFFTEPIAPSSTLGITIGVTLAATDVITVYSQLGTTSFSAFGSEI